MMYGYCVEKIDVGHLTLKLTPTEQWLVSHNKRCLLKLYRFVLQKIWEEWCKTYTPIIYIQSVYLIWGHLIQVLLLILR